MLVVPSQRANIVLGQYLLLLPAYSNQVEQCAVNSHNDLKYDQVFPSKRTEVSFNCDNGWVKHPSPSLTLCRVSDQTHCS